MKPRKPRDLYSGARSISPPERYAKRRQEAKRRRAETAQLVSTLFKYLRTERGISQDTLAKLSSVGRGTIAKIEHKGAIPTIPVFDLLLFVLHVSWTKFGAELNRMRKELKQARDRKRTAQPPF
jgi:DNA-binding XRE family transcriptional regulator